MSDVVERAKAALADVTEGPWETGETSARTVAVWSVRDNALMIAGYTTDADANFIARARSLVPELIAEVERLKAREDAVAEASYRTGQLDAEASDD